LTGRSPAALRMTDVVDRVSGIQYEGNRLIPPAHVEALAASEVTLPEALKQAFPAYRAAHFGKWHLAGGGPEAHGFDVSDGDTNNRDGNRGTNLPNDPKRCFSMTRSGIAWMNQQVAEGRPFYLQVSHYAPHLNSQARRATKNRISGLREGKRHQDLEFAAMLSDLDAAVGMLLKRVEELGISDNTYVIFTSDNGTYPTADRSNVNGPLRGSKATVWEGGVRVPLYVRGPGISANSHSRVPVIGNDLYPTILQFVGLEQLADTVEGGSLVSILQGEPEAKVERPREEFVFHWPHYMHAKYSKPDSAILAGNFKLHHWWESGESELFDLSTDLGEQFDLALERPELLADLKGRLDAYLKAVGAQLPVPNPDFDPEADPALAVPEPAQVLPKAPRKKRRRP